MQRTFTNNDRPKKRSLSNMAAENKEYIDSGAWKCSESPRGAHHWIVYKENMVCKHCKLKRPVSLPIDLIMPD